MMPDAGADRIVESLRVRCPRHVVAMVDRRALMAAAAEVDSVARLFPDQSWVDWDPPGSEGEAELHATVHAISLTVAEGIVERALERLAVPAALVYTVL